MKKSSHLYIEFNKYLMSQEIISVMLMVTNFIKLSAVNISYLSAL